MSEFLTLKEHRLDSFIFTYVVFEIQHFSAIPRTDCHPSRSITSWTSFLQLCHLRNIVFLQEDHPLNCPFYPISSIMPLLHWWTTCVTLFFRLIKEVSAFPMSTQNFIAAHCSALFKKIHFSSYDDLAMIHLNPYNSAISKLWYFKFCRCDVETLVNIIM
jgi:hypothetical protein